MKILSTEKKKTLRKANDYKIASPLVNVTKHHKMYIMNVKLNADENYHQLTYTNALGM